MQPFALLHRDGADHVEVFTGDVITVSALDDIPLHRGRPTLAVIPYRQIAERGFDCVDDAAPLECLVVRSSRLEPLDAFPPSPLSVSEGGFDLSDDEYGAIVEDVLRDEIGHGEGANFVIHRVFRATVDGDPVAAARAAFGRLLASEQGTYWTFLVHTGTRTLVGATPERHVSVADGITMMNPISGTFRNGSGRLLDFLRDPKEVEELYMVLDEELKMMATVAEQGGQVAGPYLKQMTHLTHTEYLLAGRGSLDVRDVLRETMFAPTVTGSPIENACRVIARHERRGRGYYAGVLALLDHDDQGRQTLDAPILIRTAEISPVGDLRVPVGATLVRHSTAAGEVAETHTKAAGVLAALGAVPARPQPTRAEAESPEVQAALAARNDNLARFWLDSRAPGALVVPELAGRTAVIVDGEDTFTGMLAHQLKALGLAVTLVPWSAAAAPEVTAADLVIAGPGPGDPGDLADPKMAAMRALIEARLTEGRPLLAVCLGHQILASLLGLRLHRRDSPYQGLAREIELFGATRRVGFYSSFSALAPAGELDTAYGMVEIARDPGDSTVHAVRGTGFAGVQFHPESVLSRDGLAVLAELLPQVLSGVISPATNG
ncbi:anthranilate synthase family protein [Paractinoplanes brasiliensis]|uniref:anthranilate synthase n=1 Tax=Paractinoplanes brasiliensis TaxID=52695 RepID=A0A4R6JM84_9ACTN|nr:anthranilate synthase family protein [Actinoplanes brasiliensis]TDO37454.1 phenazine biosynthesis protein phzE [Actinoplanes brasiliensis]GID29228.1 phenazine-specific anthranilate synthase component I [Actinoplanes brasiliensis]